MYDVRFSLQAEKQFSKLSSNIQKRVVGNLNRIIIRPYPHVKKLVASLYFSLRVGQYRIILDIQEAKLLILVIELGHRRNIYK